MSDPPMIASGRPVACSVIVPVGQQVIGLETRVAAYGEVLAGASTSFELLLVAAPEQRHDSALLAEHQPWLRVIEISDPSWGHAVREGIAAARGELLAYLNWERTSADALGQMVRYAEASPELVFRANRRTRDTTRQRLGSLLFNLECRAVLGTSAWDVNGTPKIFRRRHAELLRLRSDGDLIDAEFALVCEQQGYPVAEVPIAADPLPGSIPRYRLSVGLHLYLGVLRLARTQR